MPTTACNICYTESPSFGNRTSLLLKLFEQGRTIKTRVAPTSACALLRRGRSRRTRSSASGGCCPGGRGWSPWGCWRRGHQQSGARPTCAQTQRRESPPICQRRLRSALEDTNAPSSIKKRAQLLVRVCMRACQAGLMGECVHVV